MENVKAMLKDSEGKAMTYIYYSEEPTMTNSRIESIGTGSHTSYLKIATGFQNAFVLFIYIKGRRRQYYRAIIYPWKIYCANRRFAVDPIISRRILY